MHSAESQRLRLRALRTSALPAAFAAALLAAAYGCATGSDSLGASSSSGDTSAAATTSSAGGSSGTGGQGGAASGTGGATTTSSSGEGGGGGDGGSAVVCSEGESSCLGDTPRSCVGGQWVDGAACVAPTGTCVEGACIGYPSCAVDAPGTGDNCGQNADQDCCSSYVVPGGSFNRSNNAAYPATVADFRLDAFEVTVGRYREFLYNGTSTLANLPAVGAGAHPVSGGGWKTSYKNGLPADIPAADTNLQCGATGSYMWTVAPGANEALPINCVNWFEAFAFCVWDGGWMPTEAEWNYAAAGGDEQRPYPWGGTLDPTFASWGCYGDGDPIACDVNDVKRVGTYPTGAGRWGHYDLSGNMFEMVVDFFVSPYGITPCDNCVEKVGTMVSLRGGSYQSPDTAVGSDYRIGNNPSGRSVTVGFRCARLP